MQQLPSTSTPDTSGWLDTLTTPSGIRENHAHFWGNDPSTLATTSQPATFSTGSGIDIYKSLLIPALESVEEEVLFVTCFWARSPCLLYLGQSLLHLSKKALDRTDGSKIRVRLCFSSHSLFQKLFHTSSPDGHVYPSSEWESKLGLPSKEQLLGLDLRVKSIFFRPFSVMHPKFIVVDRKTAFMPSCNLSWENWYECCIALKGPIVSKLIDFWAHIWGRNDLPVLPTSRNGLPSINQYGEAPNISGPSGAVPGFNTSTATILLPSPHHSSFSLSIPLLYSLSPPPTPLNALLLHVLATASHSIRMVTPNLTSPPVISALFAALNRGVNISITTNRRMMILEQLVTAGTITEICVWKLVRNHKKFQLRASSTASLTSWDEAAILEEGRGRRGFGNLQIGYYRPRPGRRVGEPTKSHVKCTIVDGDVVVLGSGNMDRASWYTSQELGVALYGKEICKVVSDDLEHFLGGRVEQYYGFSLC